MTMIDLRLGWAGRVAVGLWAAAMLAAPVHAQMAPESMVAPKDSAIPRAGANFEGVWKIAKPRSTLQPAEAIPFTPAGRKEYDENKAYRAKGDYDDYDIYTSRCSNPGVPRLGLTPLRFKIWQRQGVLTFVYEWNRAQRQIDMRGIDTPPLDAPTMTGRSIGRWDGATLVATTTDGSERALLDDLTPRSFDAKIIERFRLVDHDTLEDRITIEDPAYYTHPWGGVITYKRQPAAMFPEDVCLDRLKSYDAILAGK